MNFRTSSYCMNCYDLGKIWQVDLMQYETLETQTVQTIIQKQHWDYCHCEIGKKLRVSENK